KHEVRRRRSANVDCIEVRRAVAGQLPGVRVEDGTGLRYSVERALSVARLGKEVEVLEGLRGADIVPHDGAGYEARLVVRRAQEEVSPAACHSSRMISFLRVLTEHADGSGDRSGDICKGRAGDET